MNYQNHNRMNVENRISMKRPTHKVCKPWQNTALLESEFLERLKEPLDDPLNLS